MARTGPFFLAADTIVPARAVRWPIDCNPEDQLKAVFRQLANLDRLSKNVVFDFCSPMLPSRIRAALESEIPYSAQSEAFSQTRFIVTTGDQPCPTLDVFFEVADIFEFAPTTSHALVTWGRTGLSAFSVTWRAFAKKLAHDSLLYNQPEPWSNSNIFAREIQISPWLGHLRSVWVCPNVDQQHALDAQSAARKVTDALDVLGRNLDIESVAVMLIPAEDGGSFERVMDTARVAQTWHYNNPSTYIEKIFLVTSSNSLAGRLKSGQKINVGI